MTITLTPVQQAALRFIQERVATCGVAPSFAEIGEALGLKAKSGVSRIVAGLEARGHIRRMPGKARAIEILTPGKVTTVPLRPEIERCVAVYAREQRISVDTAVNELLRHCFTGAA